MASPRYIFSLRESQAADRAYPNENDKILVMFRRVVLQVLYLFKTMLNEGFSSTKARSPRTSTIYHFGFECISFGSSETLKDLKQARLELLPVMSI